MLTRSARLGTARAAALGLLIAATGLIVIAYGIANGYLALAVGLLVIGVGVRITITIAALAILDGLPTESAGIGAALGDAFQEIGGALGVALLGSIFNAVYRAELPSGAPEAARSSLQGALSLHDSAVAAAAGDAFIAGAQVALLVGAGILVVIALVARLTVPADLDITEEPVPAGAVA